jgi:hypothetical protein
LLSAETNGHNFRPGPTRGCRANDDDDDDDDDAYTEVFLSLSYVPDFIRNKDFFERDRNSNHVKESMQ